MKVRATNDFRLLRLLRLSTIPERTATPASLPRDFCVVFETIFHRFFFVHPFDKRPFGLLVFPVEDIPTEHGRRLLVFGSDFYRVEVRRLVFLFCWYIPGAVRAGFCVSSYYMEKTRRRVCVVSYYMEKKPGGVAAGVRFLLKKRTRKKKHENV